MSSVNVGNQIVTFSHGNIATAKSFNAINTGLLPPGVYSGGNLSLETTNSSFCASHFKPCEICAKDFLILSSNSS